ncbi:VOC family protein [Methylobacterium radiodurans]|uniref:Glyoxalase n=1 Tax=Methylobacterium radiodurans TaxID=2202828 RepID=A0A2U8VWQ3_9HYPH|nr:glyoxalase/bleomycin resistance/extradiol dioxygenase family protein [Methylobacterium radiodurans]AWN37566.1 glyoxalase [Methylobacterium radiodurans]
MKPEIPAAVPAKGGLVAYLSLGGALKAAEFYTRALGAEIAAAMPPDDQGRTMHVHLYVNGSSLMLADAFPEYGHALQPPQAFTLTLIVDDIAAWWDRAIAAGATPVKEPGEMFWGDLYAQFRDPFGVLWALNQPKR